MGYKDTTHQCQLIGQFCRCVPDRNRSLSGEPVALEGRTLQPRAELACPAHPPSRAMQAVTCSTHPACLYHPLVLRVGLLPNLSRAAVSLGQGRRRLRLQPRTPAFLATRQALSEQICVRGMIESRRSHRVALCVCLGCC